MAQTLPQPPLSLLGDAALFLDFDGTLVELAETPNSIRVPSALPGLLERLDARLRGRLAILTGRSIADLEEHLDCSSVAIAGSHGIELRMPGGAHLAVAAPSGLDRVVAEVAALAAEGEGLLVEEKPAGIALHYRKAPALADRLDAAMTDIAERNDLSLLHGKMVLELRPHGSSKGAALRALMSESRFAGATPVVLGDDVTDEDAFLAAAALGGSGILVGPARATAAQWRLDGVAAAHDWLEAAVRG